jgi:polyisoprenyl-teichoic acid--peptidoglycan teichoic acid transferase
MARANPRIVRTNRNLDRLTLILIGLFVIFALTTAVIAFFWARSFFADWKMTSLGKDPLASSQTNLDPAAIPTLSADAPKDALQAPDTGPAAQTWDGKTRITILFMGLDYRACEDKANFAECDTSTAARTDSMMLATIDPVSKTAGLLSIPRDLWVNIPGFDYAKINTAYFLGEANKMPGGGPQMAIDTVQQVIGVPVQYYAQINFDAFVKMIDELGGVSMKIREPITVDPIGPGNTVTLEVGSQALSGAVALAYARDRHTDGGDFDRARRQQEVILAIRDDVVNLKMLPTLVTKAPALYKELQSGVRTNLTMQQIIQLAWFMQQIPKESIKRGVIGPPNDISFATSPDGQAIEIPNPDAIRVKRDEIFATGGPVGPAAVSSDPAELVKQENAKVVIKNGTSAEGLAGKTSQYLKDKGINIVGESNADAVASTSTIIDYTGKPYTIKFLSDMLGADTTRVVNRYDPNSQVDIEIVLGASFAAKNSLP